jgi:DNA-binding phage protein
MLENLWQAAVDAEVGIAISTDNRALLRQHLYRARAESPNPEFDDIVMILPEDETEIWLVHKDADSPGTDHEGHLKLVQS